MPNLTKIEASAQNSTVKTFSLSPTTVQTALAVLAEHGEVWKWFTWDDGQTSRLSDEERDRAEAITALAIHELLTEVPMFYPGMAIPYHAAEEIEIPPGWLLCDGSGYSTTEYPALFAALGYVYGGDEDLGIFNVPDYRGRSPQGLDSEAGEQVGVPVGAKIQIDVPEHSHAEMVNTATPAYNSGGAGSRYQFPTDDTTTNSTPVSTGSTGVAGGIDQRGPRQPARMIIFAGV